MEYRDLCYQRVAVENLDVAGRFARDFFGPERHPTSSAEFLYFTGPDGMTYEYSAEVCEINDELLWRNRHFHFLPKGFCKWGAAPRIAVFDSGRGDDTQNCGGTAR